jgi:hypothetical protein
MSRSGYSGDWDDNWSMIMYRGAVASALRGKRGQALLREMLAALDALPERKLVSGMMEKARGLDMTPLDPARYDEQDFGDVVARTFGIAPALAREIMWANDEKSQYWYTETPEQRRGVGERHES